MVADDEPDLWEMAARALEIAGINQDARLRGAQDLAVEHLVPMKGLALIDTNEDKVIYELTFDLPDAGLQQAAILQGNIAIIEPDVPPPPGDKAGERCYPL